MLSKLDVANLAIGNLGQSLAIINFDNDKTTVAIIIRRYFDIAVSNLLNRHPWKALTKKQPLQLISTQPSLNWLFAYRQPDDCAVVRRLATNNYFNQETEYLDQLQPFELVYTSYGYEIHTNVASAWAEYTATPAENAGYPTHVGIALSHELSMRIAPSIITNNYAKMKEIINGDGKREINQQIAIDISLSPDPINSDSPFIRVRTGRGDTSNRRGDIPNGFR